jgi:hypothetical protein
MRRRRVLKCDDRMVNEQDEGDALDHERHRELSRWPADPRALHDIGIRESFRGLERGTLADEQVVEQLPLVGRRPRGPA